MMVSATPSTTNHEGGFIESTCLTASNQAQAILKGVGVAAEKLAATLADAAPSACHSAAAWNMSSVQSKQTLILALGSFSIAALIVWYLHGKREHERRRKNEDTPNVERSSAGKEENVVEPQLTPELNSSEPAAKRQVEATAEPSEEVAEEEEAPTFETTQPVSELEEEEEEVTEVVSEQHEPVEHDQNQEEIEIPKEVEELVEEHQDQEENTEEVVILKKTNMDAAEREETTVTTAATSEPEKIPEEPTPTSVPLSLDILDMDMPANFSWSEEMERTYKVQPNLDISSDMEPSPLDQQPHQPQQQGGKRSNRNRKNRGSTTSTVGSEKQQQQQKKAAQQTSPEQPAQKTKKTANSVNATTTKKPKDEEGTSIGSVVVINDDVTVERVGYEQSESPGLASQNSEVSSQDSGRATGGLASSLSPMEEAAVNGEEELPNELFNIYEFEIPNTLVGLIIGVKGKTVKELSTRTNVRMMIREHHSAEKVTTYQICQVRGKREEINRCLCMLRSRFPPERFPELNLQPVLPPPVPNNFFDMITTQPTWLTLPEDVPCEVAIASIIDASHFFLQQPTHPSFASLTFLDMYMFRLYNDNSQIPELPVPRQNGLLCAAPIANSWFRAVVVHYIEDEDEVLVRFVDYGGYSQLRRQDLRQIRTDLMSLPFQATEVILANVRPIDGTIQWSERAMEDMRSLCTGKVITAKLVGYEVESRIPMVELYIPVSEGDNTKVICFDTYLMDKGYARTADPSKMVRVMNMPATSAASELNGTKDAPTMTMTAKKLQAV